MTPDSIHAELARAFAEDREVVVVDVREVQSRCLVVALDGDAVTLLVFGDTRATAPVPLAAIARVRVLDRASLASLRGLERARAGVPGGRTSP